jgi:hypothetical protein
LHDRSWMEVHRPRSMIPWGWLWDTWRPPTPRANPNRRGFAYFAADLDGHMPLVAALTRGGFADLESRPPPWISVHEWAASQARRRPEITTAFWLWRVRKIRQDRAPGDEGGSTFVTERFAPALLLPCWLQPSRRPALLPCRPDGVSACDGSWKAVGQWPRWQHGSMAAEQHCCTADG